MVQREATNGKELQWMTTSGNEWQRAAERMAVSSTTNDKVWYNEWKQLKANEIGFKFENKIFMQCIAAIYTAIQIIYKLENWLIHYFFSVTFCVTFMPVFLNVFHYQFCLDLLRI